VYVVPRPSVVVQTQVSPTCSRACQPFRVAQRTPHDPSVRVISTQYLSGQSAQSTGQLGLGDSLAEGDILGDILADGDTEADGETLGETEADGDTDGLIDALADPAAAV